MLFVDLIDFFPIGLFYFLDGSGVVFLYLGDTILIIFLTEFAFQLLLKALPQFVHQFPSLAHNYLYFLLNYHQQFFGVVRGSLTAEWAMLAAYVAFVL
jgi:hypothetical protein